MNRLKRPPLISRMPRFWHGPLSKRSRVECAVSVACSAVSMTPVRKNLIQDSQSPVFVDGLKVVVVPLTVGLYISCQTVTHEGRDRKPEKKDMPIQATVQRGDMPSFDELKKPVCSNHIPTHLDGGIFHDAWFQRAMKTPGHRMAGKHGVQRRCLLPCEHRRGYRKPDDSGFLTSQGFIHRGTNAADSRSGLFFQKPDFAATRFHIHPLPPFGQCAPGFTETVRKTTATRQIYRPLAVHTGVIQRVSRFLSRCGQLFILTDLFIPVQDLLGFGFGCFQLLNRPVAGDFMTIVQYPYRGAF